MSPGRNRSEPAVAAARVVIGAAVFGLAMRGLARAASSDWAWATGATDYLMAVVNLAAVWVVVLSALTTPTPRSVGMRLALGAISGWVAMSTYYLTPVPRVPHEQLWFAAAVVVVPICSAAGAVVSRQVLALGAGGLLVAEPIVGAFLSRARDGVTADAVVWTAEVVVGAAVLVLGRRAMGPNQHRRAARMGS